MPLLGLGQDALQYDISRAPSAGVSPDMGYAFNWAGPRCFRTGYIQAPSPGVSPDVGYGFNWAGPRCLTT